VAIINRKNILKLKDFNKSFARRTKVAKIEIQLNAHVFDSLSNFEYSTSPFSSPGTETNLRPQSVDFRRTLHKGSRADDSRRPFDKNLFLQNRVSLFVQGRLMLSFFMKNSPS